MISSFSMCMQFLKEMKRYEYKQKSPTISVKPDSSNDANNLFFGQDITPEIFQTVAARLFHLQDRSKDLFFPPFKILLIKLKQGLY